jgi:hypothetical protein
MTFQFCSWNNFTDEKLTNEIKIKYGHMPSHSTGNMLNIFQCYHCDPKQHESANSTDQKEDIV